MIQRIIQSRHPELGEIWHIVSARWFRDWCDEVNFHKSLFKSFRSAPVKRVPIDNSRIISGSRLKYGLQRNKHFVLLHSDAFELLLGWNGMANDSITIARKTYFDDKTKKVQVDAWECQVDTKVKPISPPKEITSNTEDAGGKLNRNCNLVYEPIGFNVEVRVDRRDPDNVSLCSRISYLREVFDD
ncbi:hypothetical protein LOD99_11549 [Oopsacas minuta]|uniref:DUSP domain-containing protein n=1 Tax=Oopsacas minuta TaxID=111878 RepID=A0AAV7JL68_9METZ|nr:hypothetical protein LOD99_11549 [Oopsacas minuta]